MYGIMYGMKKTTVYLPDGLKQRLERVAEERRTSEAEVIRTALEEYTAKQRPRPRLPLFDGPGIPSDLAARDEEYLEGFGED